MSTPTLQVVEPGILTTVQDRGRYGYQRFGVPVSGAMDEFALRAANLLVGNNDDDAGLEITVAGPRVRFLADTWIAITGADLSAELDGEPLPRWQSVEVSAESILRFGGPRDGVRAYLAVAGGIDVPLVMGSRSTYVKAAIGGLSGRALVSGDTLHALPPAEEIEFEMRRLPDGFDAPTYGDEHAIRVVLGPQHHAFSQEAILTFSSSAYIVSPESDRMGYRLQGPEIEHEASADIVSDGSPAGAVQVPGEGVPTVLLADRGTTGGYTKIATVISVDLGRLAQAMPGQSVNFKAITVEEAQQLRRELEEVLAGIGGSGAFGDGPKLSITVDGEDSEVVGDDGVTVASPTAKDGATPEKRRASATVGGETYEFEVDIHRSV